jgi:DNA-binding response OmpR family regulator
MLPPRVVVISPDRVPRALLRAELREAGYDAIGATGLAAALRLPAADRERGPVRLMLVQREAMDAAAGELLERARLRYPASRLLLLTSHGGSAPAGPWDAVLYRPVAIGEIVAQVRSLVPLPPGLKRPIDAAPPSDTGS